MRIAVASDEDAPVVSASVDHLRRAGHDVEVLALGAPWPDVGRAVGRHVACDDADFGVVWCWTGTGVSIAANKVAGVRAALCGDAATAEGARRWNDANVLALSIRATSAAMATEIIDAFLSGRPEPDQAQLIATLG